MASQHCLDLVSPRACAGPARWAGRGARGATVFLVTGGIHGEGAARLLERALADSGLAAHDPVECATPAGLPPSLWRRRAEAARLVVALGADAAAGLLGRPVSLSLERGRVRPLPDGGRLLVTEHPRAILRLADRVAQGREYRRLVNDLMLAMPHRPLAA